MGGDGRIFAQPERISSSSRKHNSGFVVVFFLSKGICIFTVGYVMLGRLNPVEIFMILFLFMAVFHDSQR